MQETLLLSAAHLCHLRGAYPAQNPIAGTPAPVLTRTWPSGSHGCGRGPHRPLPPAGAASSFIPHPATGWPSSSPGPAAVPLFLSSLNKSQVLGPTTMAFAYLPHLPLISLPAVSPLSLCSSTPTDTCTHTQTRSDLITFYFLPSTAPPPSPPGSPSPSIRNATSLVRSPLGTLSKICPPPSLIREVCWCHH